MPKANDAAAAAVAIINQIDPGMKSMDPRRQPVGTQDEWATKEDHYRFGWNACRAEMLNKLDGALKHFLVPEKFTRLTDEKLASVYSEELHGCLAESFKPVAEMPELAEQAALQALRRIARYADHLRGLMKKLADSADLEALVYHVRDSEQQGWEGPRVAAVGEAVASIKDELKAGPDDGDGPPLAPALATKPNPE